MGDMDVDDQSSDQRIASQPSPRQIPADNLQSPRLPPDPDDGPFKLPAAPPQMPLELPPPPTPQSFPPPAALDSAYDFSPPPPPDRRASQITEMVRSPQYDQLPVEVLRRASQLLEQENLRRASQFHEMSLLADPQHRRLSAAAFGDPAGMIHDVPRPGLPPVITTSDQTSLPVNMQHDQRPSLLLQQHYSNLPQSSAAPTPRLSSINNFAPVKRDSGFAPISENEPYSPVSSSGENFGGGHIDRDAMLARAYQDKQDSQVKAWERHRTTKNNNKYESEIARITAWESCQVAKAEALMKKSEEELEKKRAKMREGFKNEIASIHRRADDWRALAETRRVEEMLRTEEGAARFRATGMLPKKPLLHIQSLRDMRDMCFGFTSAYKR